MSKAQKITENEILKPSSSIDTFELPCGYWDEATQTLHREVEMREMTGEEEDLLGNVQIPFNKRFTSIFTSCITRFGTLDTRKIPQAIPQLPMGDRNFLIFALRRRSLGDKFPMEEDCPACDATHVYEFDLSQVKVLPMPDPTQRQFHVELPSGKTAAWHPMTGADAQRSDTYKRSMKSRSLNLFLRLDELDGVPPQPRDIKKLSLRDRDFLRGEFARVEGGVETSVIIDCKSCGATFERELDVGSPGFFSPSEVRAYSNRTSAISAT